jgi:hypothetical protein
MRLQDAACVDLGHSKYSPIRTSLATPFGGQVSFVPMDPSLAPGARMTGAGRGGSVIALAPAAAVAAVSSAVMAAFDRAGLAGAGDYRCAAFVRRGPADLTGSAPPPGSDALVRIVAA